MKFFFPDSQDLVDPSFDFINETRSKLRLRQRDDQYAHEVFANPPYDGMLVSMASVNGNRRTNSNQIVVPSTTLTNIFDNYITSHVDLLSIDVENYEIDNLN